MFRLPSPATFQSTSDCELYRLSASQLAGMTAAYPLVHRYARASAALLVDKSVVFRDVWWTASVALPRFLTASHCLRFCALPGNDFGRRLENFHPDLISWILICL